ncbi:MAG: porin [Gammaproteobacteria bacterium]|nr:porin [Gammaproteobacteria bacterium]
MNKKLLAVAVSAALVVPAAAMAADAFVYGHAQVEVASYSDETPSGTPLASQGKDGVALEDNARGRLGVKASEDLGNGLKAIAQFEWRMKTDEGGGFTPRVSQVGLTGGFGTFVMGNLKSPYKYTGGVKYDPFVATALQARSNGGMSGKNLDPTGTGALGHHSFVSDLVAYASPKGPFTASIGYGPSEDDGLVVVDFKYSQGAIEAFVAYLDAGDRLVVIGPNDEYSAAKVGGQWKSGSHKISAQYEMIERDVGGAATDPTVLFLGYQMKMGKNTFALQYGDTDYDVSGMDNTTYMALGVIHKMSKTTRVFGGYRDTSDVESVVTVGLRKDFKS